MDTPDKPSSGSNASPTTAPTPAKNVVSPAATLNKRQRDALFDEAAKGIVPEHRKKRQEDPLRQWWPQIKKKLREGYSVRQIFEMTRAPGINLKTSVRSLQRLINERTKPESNDAAPKK